MGFCLGCHGSLAIRSSAHCVEVGPIVALRDHVVLQVLKQAAPGAEQLVLFGSQVFQVLGARGKGAGGPLGPLEVGRWQGEFGSTRPTATSSSSGTQDKYSQLDG